MPLIVATSLTVAGSGSAQTRTDKWLERAVDRLERAVGREVLRSTQSPAAASAFRALQQQPPRRNWIQRHPVLFGTMVGFGAGFLIGYLPGDDAVFNDFDASFNGLVIGSVGALAGAIVGTNID